jgi:hypothetical protein
MMHWLISLLTGPIINGAISAYKAKLDAGNTRERIAADLAAKDLELTKRESELRAQIVVAEQGHWFTRWVRPLWAMPFIIWTWKVVFWDKVLGWGSTDELHGAAGALLVTVAGSYFIGRSAEKIVSTLKK